MSNLKTILFSFFCCVIVFLQQQVVAARPTMEELSLSKKKLLVLIIASNDKPAYRQLEKLWRLYMNSDPQHVEVYFLRGNPNVKDPEIKENTITTKTEEGYKPGIFNKTVLSLEALVPRLNEFDYILRTNLSSFYYFPALFNFLDTLPKAGCYCAVPMYLTAEMVPQYGFIAFGSGSGFIITPDVARILVEGKDTLVEASKELPDDVLIGYFFQQKGIPLMQASRVDFSSRGDWLQKKDTLPDAAYHFRAKPHDDFRQPDENFDDEIFIVSELVKYFYSAKQS